MVEIKMIAGDNVKLLSEMDDETIDLTVTSPLMMD
jgi:hypothetical protein